ncbi:MAG: dihydroorotate dehydrogenase-like protein [bacterium]|nr:dihydroorotate dehydrogenase-like protein [bacterium]
MNMDTSYLGLKLKHPLIAAANPIAADVSGIRQLEDGGAAAVILPSLFEEQITHEALELHYHTTVTADTFAEALSYFPEPEQFIVGPEEYLKLIQEAKAAVKIPVIASLNGVTDGGWTRIAEQIEQAGADAIELNMYYLATDPNVVGSEIERHYIETLKAVRNATKLPIAVKLSSFLSSPAAMAKSMANAGADGLVLFNRFYQPDFDLDKLEVIPNLRLSNSDDMRLALRWIAILFGKTSADLCATGGCHTGIDAVKLLMAGADSIQIASALLKHGPSYSKTLLSELTEWMEKHEYTSINQMKGSMSHKNVADASAYERANYMKTLQSYQK